MSRLIDADLLQEHCAEQAADEWNKQASPYSWAHAYEAFSDDVDNAPTVDAVPVVRCRYCKHFKPFRQHDGFCSIDGMLWDNNHFCKCGERRKEDTDER